MECRALPRGGAGETGGRRAVKRRSRDARRSEKHTRGCAINLRGDGRRLQPVVREVGEDIS